MSETKFYICEHCGNLIGVIHDAGVPMQCCGRKMTKLEPGTVEASREKHLPVVSITGNTVTVKIGSEAHPMFPEHSILWVYFQTSQGGQRKCLAVGKEPIVTFSLSEGEEAIAVYAYCNLHGLWKTEIPKLVCDLKPLDTKTKENYTVCKCNHVSYFDILDAIHRHTDVNTLLEVFEEVKNTTHCSTGCGGCYDKVLAIISEAMSNK